MNKKDKELTSTDILKNKNYTEPSVFQPENLLRESRRQNGIPLGKVPSVCILDPDGNLVDYLKSKEIDTRIAYSMPLYEQELYRTRRAASRKMDCPIAEEFTSKVINLPIFPSLKDDEVDIIATEVLKAVL